MTDVVEGVGVELEDLVLPAYEFYVEGLTPLVMNSPHAMRGPDDALGRKKIPTPEDEAASKAYRTADGELYLPSRAFRSSLKNAAKGRKIGKGFATSIVKGGVFEITDKTLLVDPATGEVLTDYEIFTTRAVVQNNGVMRSRPQIPSWAAKVYLEVDVEAVEPGVVEQLLQIAGRRVGVGDWRPEKDGPYGRFKAELVGEVNLG